MYAEYLAVYILLSIKQKQGSHTVKRTYIPARTSRISPPRAARLRRSIIIHIAFVMACRAILFAARSDTRLIARPQCGVMAPVLGGSPFRARRGVPSANTYSVVNDQGGFIPLLFLLDFFRVLSGFFCHVLQNIHKRGSERTCPYYPCPIFCHFGRKFLSSTIISQLWGFLSQVFLAPHYSLSVFFAF